MGRVRYAGCNDTDVLARAAREDRILVTFDKDFGDLARSAALPPTCGIILIRQTSPATDEECLALAAAIDAHDDWAGHFSVIEHGRIRRRSLAARQD